MPSSTQRPDPPYRRIVAELRARILAGDLRPGDRMPSIRQIAQRWGVAVATATKAMATLRDDGLVETKVGSGTVVSTRTSRQQPVGATASAEAAAAGAPRQALGRKHASAPPSRSPTPRDSTPCPCGDSRPSSASVRCRYTGMWRARTNW